MLEPEPSGGVGIDEGAVGGDVGAPQLAETTDRISRK